VQRKTKNTHAGPVGQPGYYLTTRAAEAATPLLSLSLVTADPGTPYTPRNFARLGNPSGAIIDKGPATSSKKVLFKT